MFCLKYCQIKCSNGKNKSIDTTNSLETLMNGNEYNCEIDDESENEDEFEAKDYEVFHMEIY